MSYLLPRDCWWIISRTNVSRNITKDGNCVRESQIVGGRLMVIECKRCLLNSDVPGVRINGDGICSVCKEYDQRWGNWASKKSHRLGALERIFNDARTIAKKRAYDVLVPLSGGKDSTYALFLCRKKFKLRCLAVTWDNHFLTEYAKANIKNAVDILGVDHIHYRVNWPLMKLLYQSFFLKTGMFCPVCMRGISVAREMAANAFNIPLIVSGTSQRTEEYVAPEYFISGRLDFFEEVVKDCQLVSQAFPLLRRPSLKRLVSYLFFWGSKIERVFHSAIIPLPEYVDWNYDEVYGTIKNELDWKAHKEEAEHTDCKMENIVQYMRQRKFPALIPEMLRYSKLVTAGIITKQDAKEKIADKPYEAAEPNNFDSFLQMFDIKRSHFEEVISDPLRHMKYYKKPTSLLRRVRVVTG
jgi:hypothetical protein